MEIRFQHSPEETARLSTDQLRRHFLVEGLMEVDRLTWVYSHYDRMIIGGTRPVHQPVVLSNEGELKSDYFLERRELGIINVGGRGSIEADGQVFEVQPLDCVYLGKGTRNVTFSSKEAARPALFYLLSAPAHQAYPAAHYTKDQASPVQTGDLLRANQRTIYKYIHDKGIQSSQLVMGLTILSPGNVWNTMPPHTHTRRTEAYFYFDLEEGQRVVHFMGEPSETRHILVSNHQALISPPWSIHAGCGTANYAFIWGMAGENYTYTDMDAIPIDQLK